MWMRAVVVMSGLTLSSPARAEVPRFFEPVVGARLVIGAQAVPQSGIADAEFNGELDLGFPTDDHGGFTVGGGIDKYVNGNLEHDANTYIAEARIGLFRVPDQGRTHFVSVGLRHVHDVLTDGEDGPLGSGGGVTLRYRYQLAWFHMVAFEGKVNTYLYGLDGAKAFGVSGRVITSLWGFGGVDVYVNLDPITKLELGFGLVGAFQLGY
jgi:hypothetical protein